MSKLILLVTTTLGKAGAIVDAGSLGSKSRAKQVIDKKLAREISDEEIEEMELDAELAAADAELAKGKAETKPTKDKADEKKGGKTPKDAGKPAEKKSLVDKVLGK